MAKHHPDLIFCRKQPGVGMWNTKVSKIFSCYMSDNTDSSRSKKCIEKIMVLAVYKLMVLLTVCSRGHLGAVYTKFQHLRDDAKLYCSYWKQWSRKTPNRHSSVVRAFASARLWHHRSMSSVWVPPMHGRRYVEEIGWQVSHQRWISGNMLFNTYTSTKCE